MRARVASQTGLTCSCGIAPNCMLAKVCSDMNKPNGQFALPADPAAIAAFLDDLSVRKLPGIGKVNAARNSRLHSSASGNAEFRICDPKSLQSLRIALARSFSPRLRCVTQPSWLTGLQSAS